MGTKYALARYTLLVAEFAVVAFILIRFVLPLVRHKENLPVAIPVLILLAAGLIKLFASHDSISHRMQRWLDRKFFREAYDAELVLSELSDQARRFTEAKPLVDTVTPPHLRGPARLPHRRLSAPWPQLWHPALHRHLGRRAQAL